MSSLGSLSLGRKTHSRDYLWSPGLQFLLYKDIIDELHSHGWFRSSWITTSHTSYAEQGTRAWWTICPSQTLNMLQDETEKGTETVLLIPRYQTQYR